MNEVSNMSNPTTSRDTPSATSSPVSAAGPTHFDLWDGPDDRPVWTGSCPCQPFSTAGQGSGFGDARHLWPAWHRLITARRPCVVFGEQVDAAIRHGWLDLVQDDLESQNYEFAAAGLPAACVGAPHIRSRLWFVAHAKHSRCQAGESQRSWSGAVVSSSTSGELGHTISAGVRGRSATSDQSEVEAGHRLHRDTTGAPSSHDRSLGNTDFNRSGTVGRNDGEMRGIPEKQRESEHGAALSERSGEFSELGDTNSARSLSRNIATQTARYGCASLTASVWSDADWLACRDGKARPVEPGTFPLAHGVPGRMGRLRAYGNAIVPQVAAEFINAYLINELA